jgi:hypothetical protein
MNYNEMNYRDLKVLCAERGLGGAGKKDELLRKLIGDDQGHKPEPFQPVDRAGRPLEDRFSLNDFDPARPNLDMAGRWIRRSGSTRPDGAICKGGWTDAHITGWIAGKGPPTGE